MQRILQRTDLLFTSALIAITLAGAFVRLQPALLSSFPLNDGGLFYSMSMDLKNNGFLLPYTTTYNLADIPFVYPPLAFYLTGLLNTLTGWQMLDILRILPALVSSLSIPAFFLLAREMTGRSRAALLGALAFAMIPRTFDWLIMGGGITRSFGLLFAILAIWQVYQFTSRHQIKNLLLFICLGALVVYSHPEATVHVAIGAGVCYAGADRSRRGLLLLAIAALAIAALSAPWWVTVLARHGLAPFAAAGAAARDDSYNAVVGLIVLFRFYFTDEPFTAVFAALGLIGFFRLMAGRRFLLLAWFFVAHLLEPRGGTLYMMLPLSIAAGIALDEVLLPALDRPAGQPRRLANVGSLFLLALFFYGIFAAKFAASKISDESTLQPTDLAAFNWVRENTAPASRFILITGENALRDPSSEWFPAISLRRSQATIFGYEWIDDGKFAERKQQYGDLQACTSQNTACLEQWAQETGLAFDYVYVRKIQAGVVTQLPLLFSLQQSPGYKAAYQSPQIDIYQRVDAK